MNLIELWINHLSKTKSEYTKNTYLNHIKHFSSLLEKPLESKEDLESLKPKDIYLFADKCNNKPQSILANLSALKHYLKFGLRRGLIDPSAYNELVIAIEDVREELNSKKEKNFPKALSEEEITIIFSNIKNVKYIRVYKLFLHSGIRLSEYEKLKFENFFIENNILWIKLDKDMTKRKKARITPVLGKTKEESIEIGKELYELAKTFDENLFVKRGVLQVYTERLSKRTNIDFSIHSFRHTYITNLVNYGFPAEIVKEFAGHENIRTTFDTYYKFSPKRAINIIFETLK